MRNLEQHRELRLNQLLNSSHVGILVVDKNRMNLMVNKYLCKMFGYAEEELVGKSANIFHISYESYQKFAEEAFEFVRLGKPIKINYQFKKKDGTIFWADIAGDAVFGQDEVLWTMVDITLRIDDKNKIKQLQERLELAFEGSRDILWDWDLKSGVFFVTNRWKDIVGYDKKDVPYTIKEWRKYIHPDDLRDVLKDTTACMRGEKKYLNNTYRLKHNDGHWIWINIRGVAQYNKILDGMRMTGTQRDVSAEKELQDKILQQQERLQYQANHDALTELPNRLLFHDRLDQAIKKAKRYKTKMALFFIDLDHFKEINDTMGHKVGDEVLKIVSKKIIDIVREEDTVARLGGDEFTIILENLKTKATINSLAKKIVKKLAEPMEYEGESLQITSSVGISIYPTDSTDSDTLLSYADTAMYDAKVEGKNNFQYYSIK